MKHRMRMDARRAALLLALLAGCGERGGEGAGGAGRARPECRIVRRDVILDPAVRETSGVAFDPRNGGVIWTHNDSGHPAELFAIDTGGRALARIRVTGAKNDDWEDLDVGPCPAGRCLYLADVGDGGGRKRSDPVALYRVPLPALDAARTDSAERLEARFPDGHRDTEAVFVLPDGSVYLVNKGQKHPIDLWRWPAAGTEGPAELVRVRTLAPRPRQPGDRVTGAAASPDGRWVAVRTYGRIAFYRTAALLGGGEAAFTMDLASLGEPQGEGVALDDDGTVVLTSESGAQGLPPRATFLQCELD